MESAPNAQAGLVIRRIALAAGTVTLMAKGAAATAPCPACGIVSSAVHDRSRRRPLDLPWRGCTVRLLLTVRRFRCRDLRCGPSTFAEHFGEAPPLRTAPHRGGSYYLLLQ